MRQSKKKAFFALAALLGLSSHAGAWGEPAVQEPLELSQARDGYSTTGLPGNAVAYGMVVEQLAAEIAQTPADSPARKLNVAGYAKECIGYIDQSSSKATDTATRAGLWSEKAEMLILLKDYAGADKAIRQGMAICPAAGTLKPMIHLLELRGQKALVPQWCSYVHAHICAAADPAKLCKLCGDHGTQVCNSAADKDMLEDKARMRVEAVDVDQRRGTSTDLSYLHDAIIAEPIVNECPRAVNLFIGEDPGGPGLRVSLPGRQTITKRLQIGSHVWLLDSNNYTISRILVRNEAPAITVNASGNGFRPGTAAGY